MLEEKLSEKGIDLDSARPAGFWIRVAAYSIDLLVVLVLAVASMFMRSVAGYILLMIPLIAYKPVLEGLLGGTAGKLALGLRVVSNEGGLLGLAGGFVRSGIFILPVIPNMMLQVKMIGLGISPLNVQEVQAFQQANMMLYMVSWVLSGIAVVSCIVVAFNVRKRGLHDMIADSFVVYKNS